MKNVPKRYSRFSYQVLRQGSIYQEKRELKKIVFFCCRFDTDRPLFPLSAHHPHTVAAHILHVMNSAFAWNAAVVWWDARGRTDGGGHQDEELFLLHANEEEQGARDMLEEHLVKVDYTTGKVVWLFIRLQGKLSPSPATANQSLAAHESACFFFFLFWAEKIPISPLLLSYGALLLYFSIFLLLVVVLLEPRLTPMQ